MITEVLLGLVPLAIGGSLKAISDVSKLQQKSEDQAGDIKEIKDDVRAIYNHLLGNKRG